LNDWRDEWGAHVTSNDVLRYSTVEIYKQESQERWVNNSFYWSNNSQCNTNALSQENSSTDLFH